MKQCGAKVEGWPALIEGMEVTAVLQTPGEWTNVIGWCDHANGKTLVDGMGHATIATILGLVVSVSATYAVIQGNHWFWLLDCLFITIAILGIADLRNKIKARKILKSLTQYSTPTPKGAG